MNRRVKLYSALNVLGWVVVMPVLLVMLLNPFVNFSGWPGASVLERDSVKVALLPPRLTEYGSLPPLTAAPRPESRVPVHTPIAAVFRPSAEAGTDTVSTRPATRGSRGQGAPTTSRRTPARPPVRRRPAGGRPTTRVVPPAAPSAPRPPAPAKPERPATGGGGSAKPGNGSGKPDDPQHGQGSGKPDDPQHGQGSGKPDDPQHGQGNGKPDDPQHGQGRGEQGQGRPDDPRPGEHGRDRG